MKNQSILLVPVILALSAVANAQPPQESTAGLTGIIQDTVGTGIPGGSVVLESALGPRREVQTDQEGAFRFSGVRAGLVILSITAPGFDAVKAKLDLVAGERRSLPPVRLNLAPTGGCFFGGSDPEQTRFLSGEPSQGGLVGGVRVGREPVLGARVTLACWIGFGCTAPGSTTTDSQGTFRFEIIRPGRYVLSIEQNGFYPLRNMQFIVVGGVESYYLFNLDPCPNDDCTIRREQPNPPKPIVCE